MKRNPMFIIVLMSLSCVLLLAWPTLGEQAYVVDWIAGRQQAVAGDFLSYLDGNQSCFQISWRQKDGNWQSIEGGWKRRRALLLGESRTFKAEVTIRDYRGGLRLTCRLTALTDLQEPYEIALSAPFSPVKWTRQFFPGVPYRILSPDKTTNIRFLAERNDWTTEFPEHKKGDCYFYPFGVLENHDVFLLWGALDVGRFAVLSPNLIPNSIPCLVARPLSLKKGDVVTFDLVLKSFSKHRFLYRDVLRWYMANWKNSDPLTKNTLVYSETSPRGLPGGTHAAIGHFGMVDKNGDLTATGKRFIGDLDSLHIGSLWYFIWHPWEELYPTNGEWTTGAKFSTNAKEVRDNIQALQRAGKDVFLYFRQFLTTEVATGKEHPDWLGRDEKGNLYTYDVYADMGKISCAIADFGNDEFRNSYLETVKKCIDFYQPAGIAFDMGWNSSLWQYSNANPRTNYAHGIAKLQADIYKWMKSKYPEKRVIMNVAYGNPSILFADGVLMESGFAGGMSDLDFEAAKATGTTVIGFEYPHVYSDMLQPLDVDGRPFLSMRYRAEGTDAVRVSELTGKFGIVRPEDAESLAIDIPVEADGKWHTATVDLRKTPAAKKREGKRLTLGFQSNADAAYVDVDWMSFSSLEIPSKKDKLSVRQFPDFIDEDYISFWESRPAWAGADRAADFALRNDKGALRFELKGKARKMSWEFLGYNGLVAQAYMKDLALGACVAGDLMDGFDIHGYLDALEKDAATWGEGCDDILSFSAKAMALSPVVDSFAIRASDRQLLASAWKSDKKLLLAAYNDGSGAICGTIELSDKVAKRLTKPSVKVLDIFGQPVHDVAGRVSITENKILLKLDGGECLLVSADL